MLSSESIRQKRKRDTSSESPAASLLCNPQLRDPMAATVLPFLANPSPLRLACRFMDECFQHSIYLEADRPIPYLKVVHSTEGVPALWKHVGLAIQAAPKFSSLCHLFLVDLPSITTLEGPPPINKEYRRGFELPPSVTRIHVTRMPRLHTIGEDFLSFSKGLEEAVFEDLSALTTVESCWIGSCSKLKKVRIAKLPLLKKIGDSFLSSCESLTEVVFEDLPALTKVGLGWLFGCEALEKIRIAELPLLQEIESAFLSRCYRLKEVRLEDLPALTSFGPTCLGGNPALQQIHITKLPMLMETPRHFMTGCDRLSNVNVDAATCHPNLVSACAKVPTVRAVQQQQKQQQRNRSQNNSANKAKKRKGRR